MASASSNATSGWERRPCACGSGQCIPTKVGLKSKYPGRYYYKCSRGNLCPEWKGWCDEDCDNVASSVDDRYCQLTGPFDAFKKDLHTFKESVLVIQKAVCVLVVVGIVICALKLIEVIF